MNSRLIYPRCLGGSRANGSVVIPLLGCLGLLLAAACSGADGSSSAGDWVAQVDTIGDTIVVHTVSGSEWGEAFLEVDFRIGALEGADHEQFGRITGIAVDEDERIYVFDSQAPALRLYDSSGSFLRTLGRVGSGPGEYRDGDGGLAALTDGRIVLRDPRNGRFVVFDASGEFSESWAGPSGQFTSSPMFPALDGGFYNPQFGASGGFIVHYSSSGESIDTLRPPPNPLQPARISARAGGVSQTWSVPFSASFLSTFHQDGHYVTARSDKYAIDLHRPDGTVLRITRTAHPVSVKRGERLANEEEVYAAMRQVDPEWRWNGPAIPTTKPLLRRILAAEDGTIWALLHGEGELNPLESGDRSTEDSDTQEFIEPTIFDVLSSDGRYLGEVQAPPEMLLSPMIIRGGYVWAVSVDQLGVQYLTRYKLRYQS